MMVILPYHLFSCILLSSLVTCNKKQQIRATMQALISPRQGTIVPSLLPHDDQSPHLLPQVLIDTNPGDCDSEDSDY